MLVNLSKSPKKTRSPRKNDRSFPVVFFHGVDFPFLRFFGGAFLILSISLLLFGIFLNNSESMQILEAQQKLGQIIASKNALKEHVTRLSLLLAAIREKNNKKLKSEIKSDYPVLPLTARKHFYCIETTRFAGPLKKDEEPHGPSLDCYGFVPGKT